MEKKRDAKGKFAKKSETLDFGIFRVVRPTLPFMRNHTVIVLAVDMQAAMSTVPGAVAIERIDAESKVLINKAVFKRFAEHAKMVKK